MYFVIQKYVSDLVSVASDWSKNELQEGIYFRVKFHNTKFNKKAVGNHTLFFVQIDIQFREFVQLDVECSMKPKQATQARVASSTASEARSINPEGQGHWSSRSVSSDDPYKHRIDRPRPLKRRRPSQTQFFSPLGLPNHTSTDQVTTSLKSSIAVSPSLLRVGLRCCATHPRYLKSDSLLAGGGKIIRRWARCSGEDACRRSPHWLPTGVC